LGLDIDERRVAEINDGFDRTGEIDTERLEASCLKVTVDATDCPPVDFYIVTVPTPVDADNRPDLNPMMSATRTVAGLIAAERSPIIVL